MKAATAASSQRLCALSAVLGLLLGGCDRGAPPATPTLEPVHIGSTDPAHRFGPFYLAGEPGRDDLAAWRDLGVRTVVDLRMRPEVSRTYPQTIDELGMEYVKLSIAGPESITGELLDEALTILGDETRHPILLHCATSNRTGAIWYAHRIVNDGLDRETALEEAKRVGLRTIDFTNTIDAHIERREQD